MTAKVQDVVIAAGGMVLAVFVVAAAIQTVSAGRRTISPLTRLQRDPLDLPALRQLARGWDRQGQGDRAEAAFSFIGRRTWRDPTTLGWLLTSRTRGGRLAQAMEIADAMLRQDGAGATRPVLFPALIAATGDGAARAALEARLDFAPSWRGEFLRALGTTGDTARSASVLAGLAEGPAPPTPAEYAPFINRLVDARQYAAAAAVWRDVSRAPGGAQPPGGDNDFARRADGTAFAWRPAAGVGASSNIDAAPEDSGRVALRVDYDGYASPILPARLLVLGPGRYRVSWRERLEGVAASSLFWRIRCADTGVILAREPGDSSGATGDGGAVGSAWRPQALEVAIPESACAGQWLELAAVPGERRSPMTAWYENILIAPAP